MDEQDWLTSAISPLGTDASFVATRHGQLVRVESQSRSAKAWLVDYASDEAAWDGLGLVMETRYFPHFADMAIAEGHSFAGIGTAERLGNSKLARIEFDDTHVHFVTKDAKRMTAPLAWYPKLAQRQRACLENYQISNDGQSVYWPLLDEGLHLEGVLQRAKSPKLPRNPENLARPFT